MHTSILGALIAFSDTPWYPIYGRSSALWGMSVLEDQQLAGLIMWIPAGLAYAVVGLWLLASWLRESDRRVKLSEGVMMRAAQ
jgi:putative membrane protein